MRIQVNARNRGYEFDARAGESVLYAGLAAGIELPYECATGTCGTCKAKLLSGRVRDGWPQALGRKYVKPEQSEFLMCQCAAEEPLTVEVPKFVYPMEPGVRVPQSGAATLRAPRYLTHDVLGFALELEAPRDYDAGQFVLLAAPGVPGYRAFSMSSFMRASTKLDFVAKRKPGGGFSEWLFGGQRAGAELKVFGPLGKATFEPSLGKNLLLIAGGSGIAGMMSILERAAQASYFDAHKGWLFFGVRMMKDLLFLDRLSEHAKRLSVTVALSEEDPPATTDWPRLRFERGLVHEVAKRGMAGNYKNVRAYVAGPPAAVDAAIRMLLLEAKLTTDNIRYDKYS